MGSVHFLRILLLVVGLSLPMVASAHSEIVDALIQHNVSCSAFLRVIAITQVCLGVMSLILLKCIRWSSSKLMSFAIRLSADRRWYSYLSLWILTSFVVSPYLGYYYESIWIMAFIPILYAFGFNLIVILFKKSREILLSCKSLFILMILSIHQMIGWVIYLCIYKIDWFENIFAYTDDLYQIGNYFVYPDLYGCKMVAEAFLVHLYWFSIPYIILILSYFVKKLLKRPSRELTFFFGDEITTVSENGITILSETSAVAYSPALNTLLGVGETVKRFPQAKIVYPIKSGVIYDFQAGEDLVVQLVKKLTKELQLRKYTLEAIVYAPSITGDLEIRAFEDSFEKAGINNISIVRY
ncbi:MAG: hypothetical protein E7117_05180 [Bacteroidales bacterium]|nr:hypothetical protein [Bacteroidales bacterium]